MEKAEYEAKRAHRQFQTGERKTEQWHVSMPKLMACIVQSR